MAKEIERKFLVADDSYRAMASESYMIRQGYISRRKEGTVRVRIFGEKAFLTVKGANRGATRSEWEYEIPMEDALEMLTEVTEGTVLDKVRYIVEFAGRRWEVDEFHGRHQGLVTAEIELESEGASVKFPPFVGREVTGDPAYYNSNLS